MISKYFRGFQKNKYFWGMIHFRAFFLGSRYRNKLGGGVAKISNNF